MNQQKLKHIRAQLEATGTLVKTDELSLQHYSKDESVGTERMVLAVCFPKTTSEVQAIVRIAHEERVPVIPRGAGSGLSGAAVPFQESIILSLEHMNRIVDIQKTNLRATVQPGVITGEFRKAVEAQGLYYPPLPSSMDYCTLGGNVSTNAGGLCAVKYGVTRKFVMELEVVLASGDVIRTGGKFIKNSTGFDLTQLITGSEGLLGIITEITFALLPLPTHRQTLLLPFPNTLACASFVCEVLATGQAPGTLEIFPSKAVTLVQKREPQLSFPADASNPHATFLLVEYDGFSDEQTDRALLELSELTSRHHIEPIVCSNHQQREQVWMLRRKIREAISREGVFVEADAVVPRNQLAHLVAAGDETGDLHQVQVFSYGHAGDGNLHTYFIAHAHQEKDWATLQHKVLHTYFEKVQALGGTLSGEHGIGELKKHYLSLVFPPHYLQLLRGIKHAFDPHSILNPGKVIPHE